MATHDSSASANKAQGMDFNLIDVFFYLLRYWPIYIVSIAAFCILSMYRNARMPYTYQSSIQVLIREASQRTMLDADMVRVMRNTSRLNMENEKLQFSSRSILERAVHTVNANVLYLVNEGLRSVELYDRAPFSMRFLDSLDNTSSWEVTYQDAGHVGVRRAGSDQVQKVPLNVPVRLGKEQFIVEPRSNFNSPWDHKEIKVDRMSFSNTVRYYQHAVVVSQPLERSSTLDITLQDRSKRKALDILLAQVAAYNREDEEVRNQISKNTADFVNERIAALSEELGIVEEDMEHFMVKTRTIDYDSKVMRYNARSAETEVEAYELETQLKLVSFMLSQLSSPSKANDFMPLNIGINAPGLDELIAQYNQLQLQRNKLVEASGGSVANPVITNYDQALKEQRAVTIEALNRYASVLRVRLQNSNGQQSTLVGALPDVSSKGREKAEIERRLAIRERLYTELLNKREEYALRQAMTQDSAYVLDMDDAPSGPVSPNNFRTFMIAFLLGLVVPSIFLIIRLVVDTKIHTRKDIMDRVTIPFLGDVPRAEKSKEGLGRVVSAQGTDSVSEAFRVLRENLRFMIGTNDNSPKRIIFTSFGESAGKSYVSYNLALTLMASGKRVVLVDLDLRKGTISRRLGLRGAGVSEFLANPQMKLSDILRKDPSHPELAVIVSGAVPPNPTELLLHQRFDDLAEMLTEQFDYVLYDNVPFGSVADAAIANRVADLTLFVLRAGKFDRRAMPDLQRIYDDQVLTNMAIILNDAQGSGHGYGHKKRTLRQRILHRLGFKVK